ncbi:MAG: GNAT family N-acetyltransferase [Micropepsaceae bacterium]
MTTLETPRLRLRPFVDADRAPFAALNADPVTMRHFPGPLTRAQSDATVDAILQRFETNGGWGQFAVERLSDAAFIGMVGLDRPGFTAPFTPTIELLWRIARAYEGHGYVTEAARAAAGFAFTELRAPRLHAFTVPANTRSRAVMERLGMTHLTDGDFDHPGLAQGHPLRRHVLYVLQNPVAAPGLNQTVNAAP